MVIDINEFLRKYETNNEEEETSPSSIKKESHIDLDFEKNVEDKLNSVKSEIEGKDFNFLKKAYFDVKKFDEDLPNKFLGIEEIGNNILKDLGSLYSNKFLETIKLNVKELKIYIDKNLELLDLELKGNNFNEMLNLLNKLLLDHKSIPNHFLETKNSLFIQIKKREILINEKIKNYNNYEIKKIKFLIINKIKKLENSFDKLSLNKIEEMIINLNSLSQKIPKLMHSQLVDEKILISNFLIKSQTFLYSKYEIEFKRKEILINELIEKFHKFNLEKDLDNLLLIYNQLIFEFDSLPEVFFEKKVSYFTKVNNLYGQINNLIIKNNMSKFYETYTSGKTLEEVSDYLSHVISNKIVNKENLLEIQKKLDSVPDKFLFEKKDLTLKLTRLLNSKDTSKIETKPNLNLHKINSHLKSISENPKKTRIFLDKFNIEKNLNKEINKYYDKIEKSKNPNELELYYEKILFYLKISNIDEISKKDITINLNKLINSKQLK